MIHESAFVSEKAKIGKGTKVWNNSQIREGAEIGENCILGKNVYVDSGVKIGDNVKIQNNSSIYHGAKIQEGVFIGPHVCITNDKNPRAVNPDGSLKKDSDWKVGPVLIKHGASLGAGTVVLPDVVIGKFAMTGAGSVVTKNVPDFGMVFGNPAKLHGYVCRCGLKIEKNRKCGKCGTKI